MLMVLLALLMLLVLAVPLVLLALMRLLAVRALLAQSKLLVLLMPRDALPGGGGASLALSILQTPPGCRLHLARLKWSIR